jgi:transposase InsO family protein
MELAAARPVIVPDTIVIDGGKVFISATFTRACERLGVSVQRARPHTPTDKAVCEATFSAINTLFCQHVASYTGSNPTLRGKDASGAWTLPELQDLLDEWLLAGWQTRPHDALRLRHPGRLPDLRLPRVGRLPAAALRGDRSARVVGGALRPL